MQPLHSVQFDESALCKLIHQLPYISIGAECFDDGRCSCTSTHCSRQRLPQIAGPRTASAMLRFLTLTKNHPVNPGPKRVNPVTSGAAPPTSQRPAVPSGADPDR